MESQSGAERRFSIPNFDAHGMVPEDLAMEWEKLPPATKSIIRRQMVSEKKHDWMIERLTDGHETIEELKRDVAVLNRIKEIVFAKWSVISFAFIAIVMPALLVWYGNYLAKSANPEGRALQTILERIAEKLPNPVPPAQK